MMGWGERLKIDMTKEILKCLQNRDGCGIIELVGQTEAK